jgi:hypothetical protein
MNPEDDQHATGWSWCEACQDWFEDLLVAIEASGGWCPRCERPGRTVRAEA